MTHRRGCWVFLLRGYLRKRIKILNSYDLIINLNWVSYFCKTIDNFSNIFFRIFMFSISFTAQDVLPVTFYPALKVVNVHQHAGAQYCLEFGNRVVNRTWCCRVSLLCMYSFKTSSGARSGTDVNFSEPTAGVKVNVFCCCCFCIKVLTFQVQVFPMLCSSPLLLPLIVFQTIWPKCAPIKRYFAFILIFYAH